MLFDMNAHIEKIFRLMGIRPCRNATFDNLITASAANELRQIDVQYLLFLQETVDKNSLHEALENSRSQIRQDVHALVMTNFKRNGFFVEFGAANGINGSNSYLLESRFDWQGIVAEPARIWRQSLDRNRRCKVDQRCVWSVTGEHLEFSETSGGYTSAPSTSPDGTNGPDNTKIKYKVETVSLNDLMKDHNAPHVIDYLSMDTEGSELSILETFDFSKHKFSFITCEHNRSENKERIAELLLRNGYERLNIPFSFEDWYIKRQ